MGEAETLRGRHLLVPYGDRIPLAEGRYYVADLVGCRVVRRLPGSEQEIGLVTEVEATGGVDLLHVAASGGKDGRDDEILIPLAAQICTSIDPEARLIVVNPPDDLLELNRQGRQG